ncbi:hypothetical protein PSQ39_16465, partial [Curvibacter sp. HBC28]
SQLRTLSNPSPTNRLSVTAFSAEPRIIYRFSQHSQLEEDFFLQLRRSTKETLSHHHFTKLLRSHLSRYTEGLFDQSSPQVYTRNQAQHKRTNPGLKKVADDW